MHPSCASRKSAITTILFFASAFSLTSQPAAPGIADLVIRGGKVITVDPADRIASAVAVLGDRIALVGSASEVSAWIGPNTKVIELNGRALLPGFIDAHSHVQGLAESEHLKIPIQIPPRKDVAAILGALEQKQAQLPAGAWLFGQGTYYQPMPSREQLDAAFPNNPVVLWWSDHDQIMNHRASIALGLTKDAPPPSGRGQYERTANGEVKIAHDAGVSYPVPQFTVAQATEALRETLTDFYLKKGVTTVTDMSDPTLAYRAYQELRAEGKLPVRLTLNYIIRPDTPDESGKSIRVSSLLNSLIASGLRSGFGDDWIRIGAIKILLDGVWGTTAATYKPFWKGSKTNWSPGNVGGTNFTQDELNRAILDAHRGRLANHGSRSGGPCAGHGSHGLRGGAEDLSPGGRTATNRARWPCLGRRSRAAHGTSGQDEAGRCHPLAPSIHVVALLRGGLRGARGEVLSLEDHD